VIRLAAAALLLAGATPALAQDDPLAPLPVPEPESDDQAPVEPEIVPPPVTQPVIRPVVVPKDWRGVFTAIRAGAWGSALAGIAALPDDNGLKAVAKAELYTARGSPKVELPQLLALLAEAPELPKADQLQRLAATRGATELPPIMVEARMVPLGSSPRRHRSRPVQGDPAADALRLVLEPLVKIDAADQAEALYLQALPTLTAEGRAEAAQRVAWIHYVLGRDADARRVAETASEGAVGEWVAQANWIAGLASWRMNDCNAAARHFRAVAGGRAEAELAAAGAYWTARSEMACRRPQGVEPLLKAAARAPDSFYGLLARETLGIDKSLPGGALPTTERIERLPNVRRALRLVEIGEYRLADDMLRHQAAIGLPSDHLALIALAQRLDFAGAQYWLAHNGRQGVRVPVSARFPMPRWQPERGWRIDPALAFAHARQESDFRAGAVSPAGAVGLMQVRPGTAGDFARGRGTAVGDLKHPPTNLEYGQSFIELMRSNPATQGQLLKIVAAYNAGPLPVARWNYINSKGDPLLWIESLPYWETRYYVPSVLRNMWVYQELENSAQPSLKSLAQHQWPEFPSKRR
jgi:soluble lytic murein transglycosylase-like protein